jgi:hypothetical protein
MSGFLASQEAKGVKCELRQADRERTRNQDKAHVASKEEDENPWREDEKDTRFCAFMSFAIRNLRNRARARTGPCLLHGSTVDIQRARASSLRIDIKRFLFHTLACDEGGKQHGRGGWNGWAGVLCTRTST